MAASERWRPPSSSPSFEIVRRPVRRFSSPRMRDGGGFFGAPGPPRPRAGPRGFSSSAAGARSAARDGARGSAGMGSGAGDNLGRGLGRRLGRHALGFLGLALLLLGFLGLAALAFVGLGLGQSLFLDLALGVALGAELGLLGLALAADFVVHLGLLQGDQLARVLLVCERAQ